MVYLLQFWHNLGIIRYVDYQVSNEISSIHGRKIIVFLMGLQSRYFFFSLCHPVFIAVILTSMSQ